MRSLWLVLCVVLCLVLYWSISGCSTSRHDYQHATFATVVYAHDTVVIATANSLPIRPTVVDTAALNPDVGLKNPTVAVNGPATGGTLTENTARPESPTSTGEDESNGD